MSPTRRSGRRVIDSLYNDPGFSYYAAAAFLILALAFFTGTDSSIRTSVGRPIAPYDIAWNALELAGAGLVFASALNRRWRHAYEAAGLSLMIVAWLMQFTVSVVIQGADDLRSYVFLVIVVAGALRYRRLLRG